MLASVQKWGNSLALCIPKEYAKSLRLDQESTVEILLEDGKLVVKPYRNDELDSMLNRVTPENIHSEIDVGAAVGHEEW